MSFVALVSEDSNEPKYILKFEEKGTAEKEERGGYGHTISTGEYFLRKKYLKVGRSSSTTYHKFSNLPDNALCTLEEVFETFVDISNDLTLDMETFKVFQMHAGACFSLLLFIFISCNLKKKTSF